MILKCVKWAPALLLVLTIEVLSWSMTRSMKYRTNLIKTSMAVTSHPQPAQSSLSLTDRIIRNVKLKFPDTSSRVVDCFERFSAGEEVDIMLGTGESDHNRQKANCFIKGLTTKAFHDTRSMPWAMALENEASIVQEELDNFIRNNKQGQEERWLGPRFQGQHYGPEWKTLGLQDRGVWDGENVDFFPNTVALLKRLQVPSQEVFFARQGPKSGIQPHSDLNNFILTAHLAVKVPSGNCWIRVGDETRFWEAGKTMAFDTSIFHSTMNEDLESDRYVLLIRFWHPDLTKDEIAALTFIFDFLDHSHLGESALLDFEMEHVFGISSSSSLSSSSLSQDSFKDQGVVGTETLTRQQRRELEKQAKKASKGKKGFHRGA